MSVESTIERVVRGIQRTVSGAAEENADSDREEPTESAERSWLDYDPERLERCSDTMLVLGLEPETFAKRLIQEHGGRLRQQQFTEYTNWSESTISRLLQKLEKEGEVVRVRLGREKIVFLPDEGPSVDGI